METTDARIISTPKSGPGQHLAHNIPSLLTPVNGLIDLKQAASAIRETLAGFAPEACNDVLSRVATDIQSPLLSELRGWLLSIDTWLCCILPLQTPVEHTPQATSDVAQLVDTISAAWTRELVWYLKPDTEEVVNSSEGSAQSTISALRQSYMQKILNNVADLLNFDVINIRQLGRLAGAERGENIDRIEERVSETLGMPERWEHLRYVIEAPPSELLVIAGPSMDEWRQPLLACFVGETSGAARLRYAQVSQRVCSNTKRILLANWIKTYGSEVTDICRDTQSSILGTRAKDAKERASELVNQALVSLGTLVKSSSSSSSTQKLLDVPRLWGHPTFLHFQQQPAQLSPRRVSIRALRLLVLVDELLINNRVQLRSIRHSLLDATLRRISVDDSVARGIPSEGQLPLACPRHSSTHLCQLSTNLSDSSTMATSLTSEGAHCTQSTSSATLSVTSTEQSRCIDVADVMHILASRMCDGPLSIVDVATQLGIADQASTIQKVGAILRKVVDGCLTTNTDLTPSDLQYISATDVRKVKGAGRAGRSTRTHINGTGRGLRRLTSFAEDLVQLHTTQPDAFYSKWGISKRIRKRNSGTSKLLSLEAGT